MYGPKTAYYSLDQETGRHYLISFYPDLKMAVPGGYGEYRVGSLGKLAYLDKNEDLLKKTFAVSTATFIHAYFYPGNEDVYYGEAGEDKPRKPSVSDILFLPSNVSILDRIYLASFVFPTRNEDYYLITYQAEKNAKRNDIFFKDKAYIKDSIGLLFQKKYRDEGHNIQVLYRKNYAVAQKIGKLLEGNGIRVSDLSLDLNRSTECTVLEDSDTPSYTARSMAEYFGCRVVREKTDVYDNIIVLGSVLEEAWEIR